ncbi:collagen-like protein [Luminiphilus sp.]|nr:collagen-like protein [Luminiphilus sp.]
MSDINLIDVVNLIRAEIARTEIGDVKRITGPVGEQGPMGETGPQGPQGPRGNDGKQGPAGVKGDQGKKGDKGAKGDDGHDGVGIARVEQDLDDAIVVYLTDGNYYTIEMPIVQNDGSLAKEVHFKSGGGGGGVVDLSGYVQRPSDTHGGKWLLYREADGTNKGEWAPATTDLIETNGMLMFRDINGRFAPTPEELDELNTQLKVNRFIWEKIQELDLKAGGVAISPDPPDDPENGMFWFDNSEDVMQLFIWHTDSDAWVPVAPPTTLEGRVSAGEVTQQAIIAQIQTSLEDQAKIVAKVEELTITKGAVSRYIVKDTAISGVASRNGELYVSSPNAADVEQISFAPFDANGQATKPCNAGDIVEFAEVAGVKNAGEVTRYKVVSGDYNAMTVQYLSGTNDFEVGEAEEVYIYPQNSDLATIEYVDAQDANKLGKEEANEVTAGFRIKGNGGTYISTAGDELGLYHVKYPEAEGHAATMGYVDDEIAKIAIPEIPDVAEPIIPVKWTFAGPDVSAENLTSGQFTVRSDGSSGTTGGNYKIYLSIYDATGNGILHADEWTHDMSSGTVMTIAKPGYGGGISMRAKTWYFNVTGSGSKQYHRLEANYWRVKRALISGHKYVINIPGILPTFATPSQITRGYAIPEDEGEES